MVTLAQRLRWARQEQGITLQQLSERTGRAVSYLSQLENGARLNPTKQTVEAVAGGLGVSPSFLFGESPRPPFNEQANLLVSARAFTLSLRFRRHWEALPGPTRWEIALDGPRRRFCLVVEFLLQTEPGGFSPVELAWQLGMSLGQYRAIMAEEEVSLPFLEQMALISGVPMRFLTHGEMAELPAPPAPAEISRYFEALRLAVERALPPERLEGWIRAQPPGDGLA